jgi:hypothetical protein
MDSPQVSSEFVTVAKFLDPAEAHLAVGALESEGIECFLQGENANSIVPMAFRTRLVVNGSDEAAAREILDAAEAADPGAEGDDAA